MIFGNQTIALHLIRGGIGFGALTLSIMAPISSWWSIGLIPVALLALKGCPICWAMGLVETIAMRVHARHDIESVDAVAVATCITPTPSVSGLLTGAD